MIKYGIKSLKLTSFDPYDTELLEVLVKNPTVQILEIGSLKNITVVPQQFPSSLKGVILHEVPKDLVTPFAEKLSQLGISQVWMDVWQKPQASAPQKTMFVSAVTEQQFRQAMILVLQNRTGTLLMSHERSSDKRLCELYEKLPAIQKQGFWIRVGKKLGMTG